jgi:HSP20 family protein
MYFRNLMSIDPWREMDGIRHEMNRLFNRAIDENKEYPAVNIWTNQESAVITAELPGYDPKDIGLSVVGGVLTISGKRVKQELKEGEQYHREERGAGNFERSVRLPFLVDNEKVEANFKNGVLQINLPRAESDKPKKIQIKTS